VFVDDAAREFVTPPFHVLHPDLSVRFSRPLTYGEALAGVFSPEAACNEAGCWSQDDRSLTGSLIERIGLPVA
jgi:hypothetical protein